MSIGSLFFKKNSASNDKNSFIKDRAPIRGIHCSKEFSFTEVITGNHAYIERGVGRPIIFCPGLYGSIYNVAAVGMELSKKYRFIVPYLPMYDLPLIDCTIPKLADYLHSFTKELNVKDAVFIGSSMGGGTSLHLALKQPDLIRGLVLCGSSGLSTIPMQKGFFKRKDFSFVKKATQEVFYDPATPTEEMVKEVFEAIQNYEIVLRSIRLTKSTANDQLHNQLPNIKAPCLLIWGKQDSITPPEIATVFKNLLPNGELYYLDHCGHVPTQEKPEEVIRLTESFLERINYI